MLGSQGLEHLMAEMDESIQFPRIWQKQHKETMQSSVQILFYVNSVSAGLCAGLKMSRCKATLSKIQDMPSD